MRKYITKKIKMNGIKETNGDCDGAAAVAA
jgi:hypothetical protein